MWSLRHLIEPSFILYHKLWILFLLKIWSFSDWDTIFSLQRLKIWNIRQIALGMENETGSVLNAHVFCSYFGAKNFFFFFLSNYILQLQPSGKIWPFCMNFEKLMHPYASMTNNFTLGKKQPCKRYKSICIWAIYKSERREVGVSINVMLMSFSTIAAGSLDCYCCKILLLL